MQTHTFASGSTLLSSFKPVALNAGSPSTKDGTGMLRVMGHAAASGAGDTASVELALVEDGVRIGYFIGTATTTAVQEGSNYLISFSWEETSNSKIDLLGCSNYSIDDLAGTKNTGGKRVWFIGARSFSSITSLTLQLSTGPI